MITAATAVLMMDVAPPALLDARRPARYRSRGVARAVLTKRAAEPDCREVVVAHHPANVPSRNLFLGLGLTATATATDERNYDGDPMLLSSPGSLRLPTA